MLAAAAVVSAPVAIAPASLVAQEADTEPVEIVFEKFVLDNGLTLIVHEDHKAPIVAVNVWYHVGSKNEKPGKTGFAHLFEHLMFNGSQNLDDDYFQVLEPLGATDLNGTTNQDRTNYFQNVPTPALDVVLWMESDRMGHMLPAISQGKLDEQRGVVQNEKRQGENQPYGVTRQLLTENTYPEGHPYAWTVIGSMEDLDAASLEDVNQWFETYYGAANATIVIAGDIDPDTALAKVERYFGSIPSGPPIAEHRTWVAKREGTHRQTVQDRVPQARLYKVWNVPEWGSEAAVHLDIAAGVLSSGKTSRLYKRLVYDDQLATSVNAYVSDGEIGGQFLVVATVQPGERMADVEAAVDEELARFMEDGPTSDELERVKTAHRARFLRGIERIGGFGGKSDVLAQSQVYGDDPEFYQVTNRRWRDATAEDVRSIAEAWLSDGVYVLEVHPFPEYAAASADVDRSTLPLAGDAPVPDFPALERATLSNGLEIVLAERHGLPLVSFDLLVDAGYAADPTNAPGTASLAMSMLDEGTENRTALEINDELMGLGAGIGTSANLDQAVISLSALKNNLDASLDLYADVILRPSFPEQDFTRLKKQRLTQISQEMVQPFAMALRVLPALLYGDDHPYATPLTGSGTVPSVTALTREDLRAYHDTWFKPNNATLVVVGDVTMDEVRPKLESLFDDWDRGDVPTKDIGTVEPRAESVVYLIDRPGALQSVIIAGQVAPPRANPDEIAIETMNTVLGGAFISRMNLNLREDKHWSYGARTLLWDARGQRPFIAYAPVQTDRTAESMTEMLGELRGIIGPRPVTAKELDNAKNDLTLTLPGQWETIGSVGNSISEIVRFGLEDDYYDRYAEEVRSIDLDEVSGAARRVVEPDRLVWIVVGDLDEVEENVRALGFGEVHRLNADGTLADGAPPGG